VNGFSKDANGISILFLFYHHNALVCASPIGESISLMFLAHGLFHKKPSLKCSQGVFLAKKIL